MGVPGFCLQSGAVHAAAPDGQAVDAVQLQSKAVIVLYPVVVEAAALLAVVAGIAEVVCTGQHEDIRVGGDGAQQLVHIPNFNGSGLGDLKAGALGGAGVQRAGRQGSDEHHSGGDDNPESGLFPVSHIFDASFRVALAEGKGCQSNGAVSGGQPQQGFGVEAPNLRAKPADHRLVTAHFHILPRQPEGHPGQRIEPVQAQSDVGQQPHNGISTLDVAGLVSQNVGHFRFRQLGGKEDFGAEDAQHKGAGDVIRHVNPPGQLHRTREPAVKKKQTDTAVDKHPGNACRPNNRGVVQQCFLRLCSCLRLCR